jgi:hypothetical protein
MEATVTMSLKEVEKLKLTISNLEKENEELKSIVKPTHYFRIMYDFSKGTSVFNAFGYEVLNEDNVDNEFEEIVKSNFEDIFTKSKENKFYQKFPKWVHRLFKCQK